MVKPRDFAQISRSRQKLVVIAQVILAELASRVAHRLEDLRYGHLFPELSFQGLQDGAGWLRSPSATRPTGH
jgi:hypothetical protein